MCHSSIAMSARARSVLGSSAPRWSRLSSATRCSRARSFLGLGVSLRRDSLGVLRIGELGVLAAENGVGDVRSVRYGRAVSSATESDTSNSSASAATGSGVSPVAPGTAPAPLISAPSRAIRRLDFFPRHVDCSSQANLREEI